MKSYPIVAWGAPLEERVTPAPVPSGNEVLVRVERCGVCHSDVHIRDGSFDMGAGKLLRYSDLGVDLPFTMGHEIVGTVTALGSTASGIVPGARVVVYPWVGCSHCPACEDGRDVDCATNASIGSRRNGGYAEYVLVPHSRYLLDYGTIDPNLAATCACSGLTAYAALKKLPLLATGETLLLIGAGGLGLAAVGLAKAITVARVAVADIDESKLGAADAAGADLTFMSKRGDAAPALLALLGGPIRAVIDFVGSPATVRLAFDVIGKSGTIVVVGLFGGGVELPTAMLPLRNITLRGSLVGSLGDLRELLALVAQRTPQMVPISTRPMREVNAALDDLQAGRVVGRVVVTAD